MTFAREYLPIFVEFARFVLWPLAPMLLAWPAWSLRARLARRRRVERGNPHRNPTARRCTQKHCRICRRSTR